MSASTKLLVAARVKGWQNPVESVVTNPHQAKAYADGAFGFSDMSGLPVDEYGDESCASCGSWGACRCTFADAGTSA